MKESFLQSAHLVTYDPVDPIPAVEPGRLLVYAKVKKSGRRIIGFGISVVTPTNQRKAVVFERETFFRSGGVRLVRVGKPVAVIEPVWLPSKLRDPSQPAQRFALSAVGEPAASVVRWALAGSGWTIEEWVLALLAFVERPLELVAALEELV